MLPVKFKLGNYKKPMDIGKCPFCYIDDTLLNWDTNTYNNAPIEARLMFVSLTDIEAYFGPERIWYMCPHCGEWTLGSTILV